MKILAISPFFPQRNGGATSIYEFFSRLTSQYDYQISVISYTKSIHISKNLEVVGFNLPDRTSFSRGIRFIFRAIFHGLKLCRRTDYDFIYSKNITTPSIVAYILSLIKQKPLVVHTSGGDIQELDPDNTSFRFTRGMIRFITFFIRKKILKRATIIIANCYTDYSVLEKLGFSSKTEIIRNGVDLQRFYPLENKIIPDVPRLIFVGRPEPEKNPDHVLEIASRISNPFLIIGGTVEEFKRYGDIPNNVKIIGIVGNIEEYYRNADIFIQTSSSEGLSNALLEAMASGNVPVTYPSGDAPMIIKNGENGYICKNQEEVIDIVKFLGEHKEELERIGRNALNTIHSLFAWDSSVSKLDSILRSKFNSV
ncbi:MAG: glycosyltransferase family 4 protein [Candidatus Helarchaeota archaeon]